MRRVLNANLPIKTAEGLTQSWRVIAVPRSSSLTNERESPLIAAKNIITHKIPDARLGETVSPAVEKRMIERVTTTNIRSEFNA